MDEAHDDHITRPSSGSRELTAQESALLHRLAQAGAIADRLAATDRCHVAFIPREVHAAVTRAVGHRNPSITILPADDPAVLNLAQRLFTCWVMTNFEECHPTLGANRQALASLYAFRDQAIPRVCGELETLDGLDVDKIRVALATVAAEIGKLQASVPRRSQMAVVTPVSWQFFAAFLAPAFVGVLVRKPGGTASAGTRAMYRFIESIMPFLNEQQPTFQAIRSQFSRKRPVRTRQVAL